MRPKSEKFLAGRPFTTIADNLDLENLFSQSRVYDSDQGNFIINIIIIVICFTRITK